MLVHGLCRMFFFLNDNDNDDNSNDDDIRNYFIKAMGSVKERGGERTD